MLRKNKCSIPENSAWKIKTSAAADACKMEHDISEERMLLKNVLHPFEDNKSDAGLKPASLN